MFSSLCSYLVIVSVLLNLTEKVYCHDPDKHLSSFLVYGPNVDLDLTKKISDTVRQIQSQAATVSKSVLDRYLNYQHGSRIARSVNSARRNPSSWSPNRVDNFNEHERNYGYYGNNRMNSVWNNTNYNRTNTTRYNGSTTYPRRRQEGMFLNTTAPERHRNLTYPFNGMNFSLPSSNRRNQSSNFYGNNTYNYNMPTNRTQRNRLNQTYPFTSRWTRNRRYIDNNNNNNKYIKKYYADNESIKYNETLLDIIKNIALNEHINYEKNQLEDTYGKNFLNNRKWIYGTTTTPASSTTTGKQFEYYDKESEEISNNIIDNYPIFIDYSLKNKLEKTKDILNDDFQNSDEKFEENVYSNQVNTIKRLNKPQYKVIELSNDIVNDYDNNNINNNILLKNEQLQLEQELLSSIYPKKSDRKKMLQKRKEDNKKYYEDSNNIETTISTLVKKLKSTPKYRTIGNTVNINRIIHRDEIITDNVKPVLQFTTLSVLNQPHDDTVLIQVPPRRITCPPNTRLARGRCRTIW